MSLRRDRGFSHSLCCFLLFQISDMEHSALSGSENGLNPERQQLVQRRLNFKYWLCWVWRVSEGRGSCAGGWQRREAGLWLPPVGSEMATAGPGAPRGCLWASELLPRRPCSPLQPGYVLPLSTGRKREGFLCHRIQRNSCFSWIVRFLFLLDQLVK